MIILNYYKLNIFAILQLYRIRNIIHFYKVFCDLVASGTEMAPFTFKQFEEKVTHKSNAVVSCCKDSAGFTMIL